MSESNFVAKVNRDCSNSGDPCLKPVKYDLLRLDDNRSGTCARTKHSRKPNTTKLYIRNKRGERVYKVKVDGCLIDNPSGKRVDWALYSKSYERLILVELKGSHVERSLRQFNDAAELFEQKGITLCVIVYTKSKKFQKREQKVNSVNELRAKLKSKGLHLLKDFQCNRQGTAYADLTELLTYENPKVSKRS